MVRRFDACPFCGYHNDRGTHVGFTSIEFSYSTAEVRLWNGTFVEHRHVGIQLPDPSLFAIGGNGGKLTIRLAK